MRLSLVVRIGDGGDAQPQGRVVRQSYESKATGGALEYYVYTPPGYDAKRPERYPVLYLLHGAGQEAHAWVAEGGADTTLDKLISAGKARPMIVVMPKSTGTPDHMINVENFSRALLSEIIPRIEATFHASSDRLARAVAGLSMGGGEALVIGLSHLDRFAWIGGFSPASAAMRRTPTGPWDVPSLDATVNARIKLLYLTCGTADRLIGQVRQFRDFLGAAGVRLTFVEHPDAGHVWPLWTRNLADLAQMLFQESAK